MISNKEMQEGSTALSHSEATLLHQNATEITNCDNKIHKNKVSQFAKPGNKILQIDIHNILPSPPKKQIYYYYVWEQLTNYYNNSLKRGTCTLRHDTG